MRKILVSAAAVAAIATAAPAFAQAGPQSTASATASAKIVAPIQVTNDDPLNFGVIAADGTNASFVNVNSAGLVTSPTPNLVIDSTGSAASFDVTGEPNLAYNVVVPSTALLNGPSSSTMTATLYGPTAGALDATGADSFKVTGDLAIAATQTPGTYTGTFNVSVQYQ